MLRKTAWGFVLVTIFGLLIFANLSRYFKLRPVTNLRQLKTTLIAPDGSRVRLDEVGFAENRVIVVTKGNNLYAIETVDHLQKVIADLASASNAFASFVIATGTPDEQHQVIGAKSPGMYGSQNSDFVRQLAITHFPTTLFVNKSGEIVGMRPGEPSVALLRSKVRYLMATGRYLPDPKLDTGMIAPNFEGIYADGSPFSLAQTKEERPTLLVFSETGCGYCERAMSNLSNFTNNSTHVIAVVTSPEENPTQTSAPNGAPENSIVACSLNCGATVKSKATTTHSGIATVTVPSSEVFESYGVQVVPTFVWIDAAGKISGIQRGYLGESRLRALLASGGTDSGLSLAIGSRIPNFNLQDESGKSFSDEQLKGKYSILVFAAEKCPACHALFKYLAQAGKDKRVDQLVTVMMNTRDEIPPGAPEQLGPVLLDGNKLVSIDFDIRETPTIVYVNPDRSIFAVTVGFATDEINSTIQKFRSSTTAEVATSVTD